MLFPCGTTRLFRSLFHERSTSDDPAWAHLENPDRTGFCGIMSCSPVICNGFPDWFSVSGCCVDDNGPDGVTYDPVDSDVVGFESAADDENGCHSAIILEDDEHGAFPPNTLFRLKRVIEAGFWEAPGGIFPEQRLLIVTATYRAPRAGLSVVSGVGGKMCEPATSLQYGLRSAYIAGLDDILARPTLTLELELSRKITWTDWKGVKYNMKSEFDYVRAPASATSATPGTRDANNEGKTPDQFLEEANELIRKRRQALSQTDKGRLLPEQKYAYLTMEEVLAVRMYSGPAYQPINTFLRSIGQLRGDHRMRLAQDPESTFAATTAELCKAIRKLAAIVSPAKAMQPLARGRGARRAAKDILGTRSAGDDMRRRYGVHVHLSQPLHTRRIHG